MNVFKNIAFGLEVLPRRFRLKPAEVRARVSELLRLVQLGGVREPASVRIVRGPAPARGSCPGAGHRASDSAAGARIDHILSKIKILRNL